MSEFSWLLDPPKRETYRMLEMTPAGPNVLARGLRGLDNARRLADRRAVDHGRLHVVENEQTGKPEYEARPPERARG